MGAAVERAIDQAGAKRDQVARVGLGSPGTMDIPAGMLLDPPNLPGWTDFPIRARLEQHCGLPVTLRKRRQCGGLWRVLGRQRTRALAAW